MANYKARMPMIAKRSDAGVYSGGLAVGKLIQVGITPAVADVKLYGDDVVAESVVSFTNAAVTLSITTVPVDAAVAMFNVTKNGNAGTEDIKWADNNPEYVGFGFITTEMVDNADKVKVTWLPKVKFALPTETYDTKGESVTFGTPALTATAYKDDVTNEWKHDYYCATADAAVTKLKELCGITSGTTSGT